MFRVSYYLHQSSEIGDLSSTQSFVVTFTTESYVWCATADEKCLLYSQVSPFDIKLDTLKTHDPIPSNPYWNEKIKQAIEVRQLY